MPKRDVKTAAVKTKKGIKVTANPYNADNHNVTRYIDFGKEDLELGHMGLSQKRGTLAAIDAIKALFGRSGEYWVQGDYGRFAYDKDGSRLQDVFNGFCLSGAAAAVNGRYEGLARAAITVAILTRQKVSVTETRDVTNDDWNIIAFNDQKTTTWKDVLQVFRSAKRLVERA